MVGLAGTLAIALVAVLAPFLPAALGHTIGDDILAAPDAKYWFGTDDVGRDLFWRVIRGSTYSLGAGLSVVCLALVVGVPLGMVAGFCRGRVDLVLMRLTDAVLAFPPLLLALGLIAALGASLRNAVLAIGIVYAPRFARVARGATLQVCAQEYVLASRMIGTSTPRILLRHVLPNIASPIIVLTTINISSAILEVAALSFLGLGEPDLPEWGAMLNEGRRMMAVQPSLMIYPGMALAAAVFSFNVLGDALRDAFDVRL